MKQVKSTSGFRRHYAVRIAKNEALKGAFIESVNAFLQDRSLVDDHPLQGKMSLYRSFSITGNYRVVYSETPNYFLFVDVGTHEQVYYQ